MHLTLTLAFLASSALVSATLDPARSNTKNKCPSFYKCDATKVSNAIQAAECSHNTRTYENQTFAVFMTDHQYDGNHGYPYGTCYAYVCLEPTLDEMLDNDDCWTFFWNDKGITDGYGTDCIKDPNTSECGCEDSASGKFVAGKTDCI